MSLREAVGSRWLEIHVSEALREDLGRAGDITCEATVPETIIGQADLVAKQVGVLAGADWAILTGERTEPPVNWEFVVEDGTRLKPGQVVAHVRGPLWGILISERTAINGLARLSGIAGMTNAAVKAVRGTRARVLDTRKTTPGWRVAEKYAVRIGGGANHRVGLYDEILIKENHIEAAGGIGNAMERALEWRRKRALELNVPIEIEVKSLEELKEALVFSPERILLDNFSLEDLKLAVKTAGERCELEASGGITLQNIADVAASGVRRISLGALTHSAPPLDLSLLVKHV
ncbi:carboxylating nicotinate-nucleotide diphosphorylase [bacterium]|nr:carboxylating nicotinate-nucleotide diphosphorylase [bacterium]